MTNRFLSTAETGTLSGGTTLIFGSTIGAIDLLPDKALKTDALKNLISTNLEISDINGLSASLGWGLTGNAGTVAGTNFIGTTDSIDMVIKTNDTEKVRVTSGGDVGIGATPNEQLEITKNFRLPKTTATVGQIKSDGDVMIHRFGTNNFFAGTSTGNLTLSGCEMCAVGPFALTAVTSADSCAAFGVTALQNVTTGSNCTACGHNALRAVVGGTNNSGFGGGAGDNIVGGTRNTALGASSMGTTSGGQNTFVGAFSGLSSTTGSQNSSLGDSAGPSSSALSNTTSLGFFAVANASNKIRVGNASVTVIEGQVDWTFSSSANLKEHFVDLDGEETLEKLKEIRVPKWNYIGDCCHRHIGPMAQDIYKHFGKKDEHGCCATDTTINSSDLSGIALIGVKALEKRTREQKELIDSQKILIDSLQLRVSSLETQHL